MTTFQSDLAETQFTDGPADRFAYRHLGPSGGTPLVMAMRFRGTVDHWDPAFLEVLSSERDVIVFDNRGTGSSSGTAPDTVDDLAAGLLEFTGALGLTQFDLLGWSMGGYVVQAVALARPDLVRRLVVAGSGPGRLPDAPAAPARVWEVAGHEVNDDEDFLYLFYPGTDAARQAGLESLRRLDTRLQRTGAAVSPVAVKAQVAALGSLGLALWDRLGELTLPVLVANGAHDVMIHSQASYAMSQRLPNAKIVLYSDAGHGFLFQHPGDFGREVLTFLR